MKLNSVTNYVNRGIPPVYTQNNSGTVVINQKCIRDGQVNFNLSRLTNESVRQVPQDKLVQPYDILINSTGTGTVGRVAQVVDLAKRTTVDSHVTIVRPKKETVDPSYLGHWLKTKQEELEGLAGGSTNQVELSRTKIAEIKVILPPIKTQKKISEIITALDSAITKTGQIIQKTEFLKQGLMQELFIKGIGHKQFKQTDIGKIPSDWNVLKLKEIARFTNGKAHEQYISETGKFIVVNSKFISSDGLVIKRTNKCLSLLNVGDIAMVMSDVPKGKALAKCFLVEKINTYTLNQRICALTPSKINGKFLFYILNRNSYFLGFDSGVGQTNLRKEEVVNCPIQVPSEKEQLKIVELLEKVDLKLSTELLNKKSLLSLKNGLMQDIFSQKVQINQNE